MYACSRSHCSSWLESLCCRRDLLPRSMLTRSQRTRRRLSALCRQWPAGQREKLSNVRNGVIGRRCAIPGPCPLCPRKRTSGRPPRQVRFVPIADICTASKKAPLFDHFVGESEQGMRRPTYDVCDADGSSSSRIFASAKSAAPHLASKNR